MQMLERNITIRRRDDKRKFWFSKSQLKMLCVLYFFLVSFCVSLLFRVSLENKFFLRFNQTVREIKKTKMKCGKKLIFHFVYFLFVKAFSSSLLPSFARIFLLFELFRFLVALLFICFNWFILCLMSSTSTF